MMYFTIILALIGVPMTVVRETGSVFFGLCTFLFLVALYTLGIHAGVDLEKNRSRKIVESIHKRRRRAQGKE